MALVMLALTEPQLHAAGHVAGSQGPTWVPAQPGLGPGSDTSRMKMTGQCRCPWGFTLPSVG